MKELRKVEIFENGQWNEIEFKDLKLGNKFRLFEPDGERVIDKEKNEDEWMATSDAYLNENEVYQINI